METPKPKGGRPRRRPVAAHDARRTRLRLRRAGEALQALRWELQDNGEVRLYLYERRRGDVMWLMEKLKPIEETIGRLNRTLMFGQAEAEGLIDA